MISPGGFLYFGFLMQDDKQYNYFVFYWPISTVFLMNINCFPSSSVNAKKKL